MTRLYLLRSHQIYAKSHCAINQNAGSRCERKGYRPRGPTLLHW